MSTPIVVATPQASPPFAKSMSPGFSRSACVPSLTVTKNSQKASGRETAPAVTSTLPMRHVMAPLGRTSVSPLTSAGTVFISPILASSRRSLQSQATPVYHDAARQARGRRPEARSPLLDAQFGDPVEVYVAGGERRVVL